MFRKLTEHSKTILYSHPHVAMFMAGFVFFLYRMFFLPGFNFNARLWDEEIGWEKDFRQRGFFEWLTYRDAPGYFVFLPRLILSACHLVPISMLATTLRAILILINLICVYFAAKVLNSRNSSSGNLFLIFCCFSSIYIADLNFLHNIAYYFFFPILFLMQKISDKKDRSSWLSIAVIVVLIAKPIIAILMIILLGFLLIKDLFPKWALRTLIIYSLFYLASYFFLPNRWQTPSNSDLTTIKPLILNIPWVLGMTFFPIVYFGLNGFLHFLRLELIRNILGFLLYVVPVISAVYLYVITKSKISWKAFTCRVQIGILLLLSSYLLVYLNYDSYWIKAFPLYSLNVPQDLWLRWSSLIPILVLSVLWEFGRMSGTLRFIQIIFCSVFVQEFVFQIAAYSWLKR